MYGTIEFSMAGRQLQASLEDDLTWHSTDDRVSAMLNDISDGLQPTLTLGEDAVRHAMYRVAYRVGGSVRPDKRRGRWQH